MTSTKPNLWGVVLTLVAWAIPVCATAATLLVPSEYPTIQAAIDASVTGDVVLVAPGTYTGPGNRNLDPGTRDVTILGEGGPEETVIDCEGQGRALWVHGGQTEAFQFIGFTVRNGAASQGAGFRVDHGSRITMSDCVFDGCDASGFACCFGDGILRRTKISNCAGSYILSWETGVIEECEIVDNSGTGLIVSHPYDGELVVEQSVLSGNDGALFFGADHVDIVVRRCVLANYSGLTLVGEAVNPYVFEECTIAGLGRVEIWTGRTDFRRCVLSGLPCDGLWNFATVSFTCCLFDPSSVYNHGDDPVIEGGYVDGDPMYCEPQLCSDQTSRGDFSLHEDSPCTAENSPCGEQIGAFGVGCGVASVELVTEAREPGIAFTCAMPARDALCFRLLPAGAGSGSASGPVVVEILTLGGRRIATHAFTGAEAGAEFEWDPRSDGAELVSGIYFLRAVRGDGSSAAAKFVWLD